MSDDNTKFVINTITGPAYFNPYMVMGRLYCTPEPEGMEYIRQCRAKGDSWLDVIRELGACHVSEYSGTYIILFVTLQTIWLATVWGGAR